MLRHIQHMVMGVAGCGLLVVAVLATQAVAAGPASGLAPAPAYGTNSMRQPVLPAQREAILPTGQSNLVYEWVEHGGARLYWNTLLIPRQIRMAGARFVDPALTPPLMLEEKKPARPRHKKRKTQPAAPAKPVATQQAPAHVGNTALRPPEAKPQPGPQVTPPAASNAKEKPKDAPKDASKDAASATARPPLLSAAPAPLVAAPVPMPAAQTRAALPMPRNPVSPLQ